MKLKKSTKIILISLGIVLLMAITNPSLKSFIENYNYDSENCAKHENYFIFSFYTYTYDQVGNTNHYHGLKTYIGILGNFFEWDSEYFFGK